MALPTSSIGQQAIKTALGTSETGVLNLCRSAKINKWAGRKPFRSSAEKYTYSELVAALKAANFGLQVTGYSSAAAALDAAAGTSELWPYLRPQATQSSPCRQGDFRGYEHTAPVPYNSAVTSLPGTTGSANASFEVDIDQASGAEVLVGQMAALQSGKWVMLWRKTNGSTTVVNGANVSSASYPFSLTVQDLAEAGTYEVCAAVYANSQYYPVPNTYKSFQVTFIAPSLTVQWNICTWNAAMTEVEFEIAIRNSGAGAQQISAHTVTLRETSSTPQAGVQPSGSSPASFTTNAVSVPANSAVVIKSGKFTGITYNAAKAYFVILSGLQISYEYNAIEEPDPEE